MQQLKGLKMALILAADRKMRKYFTIAKLDEGAGHNCLPVNLSL